MSRHLEAEVTAYRGLCETLAERLARSAPNEYDDMVQEGLIDVWLTLKKGRSPSAENVERRMMNWLRLRRRQLRHAKVDYNKVLPMQDLRDADAQAASVSKLVVKRQLDAGVDE